MQNQNYIARLNWLMTLGLIMWIVFLPSSCGNKKDKYALCIKDAKALPNGFIYCDSSTNTIRIMDIHGIKRVIDSILIFQGEETGTGTVSWPTLDSVKWEMVSGPDAPPTNSIKLKKRKGIL